MLHLGLVAVVGRFIIVTGFDAPEQPLSVDLIYVPARNPVDDTIIIDPPRADDQQEVAPELEELESDQQALEEPPSLSPESTAQKNTAVEPPVSNDQPKASSTEPEQAPDANSTEDLLRRPTAEWLDGIDLSEEASGRGAEQDFEASDTVIGRYLSLQRCIRLSQSGIQDCASTAGQDLNTFLAGQSKELDRLGYFR
ncbi:MAG: hypothetical protein AAFX02_11535, partial [Pseudomonadota bacterium]